MFFDWFDTSEVDAFAASLANEFMQRLPKDDLARGARGIQARTAEATGTLMARIERFAAGRRLNIFKRARLANTFKWKLQEAGYAKDFVDRLTLDVAKRASLTKPSA